MNKEIKVVVSTDKIGSTVESIMEVDVEDWDELTEMQRSDWVFEHADQNMMFQIDWEDMSDVPCDSSEWLINKGWKK